MTNHLLVTAATVRHLSEQRQTLLCAAKLLLSALDPATAQSMRQEAMDAGREAVRSVLDNLDPPT